MLQSIDPRTGEAHDTGIAPTSAVEVAEQVSRAQTAFETTRGHDRAWRAGLLDALASALEARRDELVAVADGETALGALRLRGEVGRAAFQFRMFSEVVREGSYVEATIDHAADTALGAAPDVRRMLVPLGPVAVFGSSNFPFAFSVAGGDTASALAAGNAVVVKAHGSHPETSARSHEVLTAAASAYGAPEGLIGIVYGTQAGVDLVADPRVRAVGFTGSLGAADALMDVVRQRDEPIPFYGELSSINPLVVTADAARTRAEEIAEGLFGSFTLGSGQFCTKPGIAFVPRGVDGDALVSALAEQVAAASGHVLLNERIATSFAVLSERVRREAGVVTLAEGEAGGLGLRVPATLLATDVHDLTAAVAEEVFGPMLVVARYDSMTEIADALGRIPASLTASLHHAEESAAELMSIVGELTDRAGRIVFNEYPTGVRVSWAQHHGGPWPATNSQFTSVGAGAIRRFLRPLAYQSAPAELLPAELSDGPVDIPRRVDGVLVAH